MKKQLSFNINNKYVLLRVTRTNISQKFIYCSYVFESIDFYKSVIDFYKKLELTNFYCENVVYRHKTVYRRILKI